MAYVTIEEAAKLTGKSIQSIYRHVKNGKVSRHNDGFDISELLRVYGPLRNTSEIKKDLSFDNEKIQMLDRENDILRKNTEQLLKDKQILYDIIKKLETDKEKLYEVIEDYQRKLPSPSSVQPVDKRLNTKSSLWKKIFKY
jgi:hypothetical protein